MNAAGLPSSGRTPIDPYAPETPSIARVYDYWLGGKDNSEADREHAHTIENVSPWAPSIARANRRCIARIVGWCVAQGIDQVLSIGTGLPTLPSPYSAAWGINPNARVIGVDNDPVVLAHGRARARVSANTVHLLQGDIRRPETLTMLDRLDRWDWHRPCLIELSAVLHFIDDGDDPYSIMARLRQRMAPGSFLIVSHASTDGTPEHVVTEIQEQYLNASAPISFRSDAQIAGLAAGDEAGWELAAPGVVAVQDWPRPGAGAAEPVGGQPVRVAVAVGRRAA